MTIFVSIASYCDPMLDLTINELFKTADDPYSVHVGVVDQSYMRNDRLPRDYAGNIRYVWIDYRDTLGLGWARSLAASMYREEAWYFQIDSHMVFDQGWDSELKTQANACSAGNSKVVLSSYPRPFKMIDGSPVKSSRSRAPVAHVLHADSCFTPGSAFLRYRGITLEEGQPLRSSHISGGCLFARGDLFCEMPYDPYMYFNEEEQAIAVRAFTHGWDSYYISNSPIYHLYESPPENPIRPLHWDEGHQRLRAESLVAVQARSTHRLLGLLSLGKDLGTYGLGRCRSLDEYAEVSGIDYINRTITDYAYKGIYNH